MPVSFKLLQTDGSARRGRLTTARAVIETPAFMPVGTLATVKTLRPEDIASLGYRLILANAYHLHLRPGEDTVARLGGVQRMMGWDGALLTDSGGYQVFSLAAIRQVNDDGVVFQTADGERKLTPESVMAIQRALGSDIAMVLDECPPIDAPPDVQRTATDRTHRWAERCLASPALPNQARFPIVQGGNNPRWRAESARFLAGLPGDGYGIGGLSLGESKSLTWELAEVVTSELPTAKPRYLMGVGAPEDLLEGVARGVDLFDSVLPTRIARHGAVFTPSGRISLKSVQASDPGPIDPECDCLACAQYSRGWMRHLFSVGEPLGLRLATMHNLRFLSRLMANIRDAVEAGQYWRMRDQFLARLTNGPK